LWELRPDGAEKKEVGPRKKRRTDGPPPVKRKRGPQRRSALGVMKKRRLRWIQNPEWLGETEVTISWR